MSPTSHTFIPKLRFPEFSGSWEEKKIENLVWENVIDKPLDWNHWNIHPTSSDYVEEWIPFIMANDIENWRLSITKSHKIRPNQAKSLQKWFSVYNDVLLTHKWSIWLTAIVPKLDTDYIVLTPQVTYYRVINYNKLNNIFLKYMFDSKTFQQTLHTLADSGTRPYIWITEQRKLRISLPSLIEQIKIASFLSAVDEKIQQLTDLKSAREHYKTGMMQQMFSQQIRFRDEHGNNFPKWEEKRLGEICEIQNNKRKPVTAESRNTWTYPYYGATWIIDYVEDYIFKEELLLVWEDWAKRWKNETSAFIAQWKYWVNNHAHVLKIKPEYNILFLMNTLNYQSLLKYVAGNAPAKLTLDNLKKIPIIFPSLQEQEKIANFLTQIDAKIAEFSDQIEKAKQWKKWLLQGLFI